MKVAITGSSGYIGGAVAARLTERGHEVTGLRRGARDAPGADWAPQEDWVRDGALDGVDAVVHLAGVSIGARRWTPGRRELLRSSRIDATRTLVRHLVELERPPGSLLSASAIGYYGHRTEGELTEESARGQGFLADLVADWEEEARAAEAAGIRTLLLRTAPVLGPGSELVGRLAPPFKVGLGGPLGSGRQWFSWVSASDLVRAIEHGLEDETLSGPVNVAAPNPVTNRDFTKALGRVLRRPALLPLPSPALRLIFGRGRAEETLLASQRVLPARLETAGFAFEHPEVEAALRSAFA
jgi:uncharacterized protein (TIGR01777 family)